MTDRLDELDAAPTVRELADAIMSLRQRSGINIEKVGQARRILELRAVRNEASHQRRALELGSIAFSLIE